MSIYHYIKTEIPFDFEKLQNIFSNNSAISLEQRNENLCYFWQNNNSTRGIDVSFENGLIELRNTIMSNETDYQITKFLAHIICENFKGETFVEFDDEDADSDDESLKLVSVGLGLYDKNEIEKMQLSDVSTMRGIIEQTGKYISIFGPIRKVHFGTDFMNTYKDKTDEELITIMHDLIKKVNYQIPNYEYGNVMETGDGDNIKILKLISNKVDCIIDKYDYILFQKNEEEIIAIDNNTLNTILPNSWQRVDEYTIVAPIISENEFMDLIEKADKLNQFEELRN
ncbi:MAG: hypothetical protein K2P85_11705 [Flavobacteriaceae bacterium]|nr:hypothetical protein [Flavobacteriaceae bacterium]